MLPLLGFQEGTQEPAKVGWLEGDEAFTIDEEKKEEEMERLLDQVFDVQGLIEVSSLSFAL